MKGSWYGSGKGKQVQLTLNEDESFSFVLSNDIPGATKSRPITGKYRQEGNELQFLSFGIPGTEIPVPEDLFQHAAISADEKTITWTDLILTSRD